ncbi:hypothetical protein NM688_g7948 [Phlebia brevispora]|uniref:Uncharacterized protein n=1 Tax=Phlebia brevispora TaxID=194682 RepID=A0ACC1RZ95_9APHY|nr:hypothetical protein NM688_g7948 [Phlebia brevispora]
MFSKLSLLTLLYAFVAVNASPVYSSVESSTPESASLVTSTYTGTKVVNTILTGLFAVLGVAHRDRCLDRDVLAGSDVFRLHHLMVLLTHRLAASEVCIPLRLELASVLTTDAAFSSQHTSQAAYVLTRVLDITDNIPS